MSYWDRDHSQLDRQTVRQTEADRKGEREDGKVDWSERRSRHLAYILRNVTRPLSGKVLDAESGETRA